MGKSNTYSNVVTVNTRNQKALQDDDREKRSTTAISEQPYAMKAYVSGETKFTITQGMYNNINCAKNYCCLFMDS